MVFLLRSVVGVKSLLFHQEQMRLPHLEGASYFGHIPRPTKIETGDTTKNDFSSNDLASYLHSFCILWSKISILVYKFGFYGAVYATWSQKYLNRVQKNSKSSKFTPNGFLN